MGDVAGNVGADHAIFEQGASAGNVGNEKLLEQKKANPVALLLSSAMMLRHLQFPSFADRLETAVKQVIKEGEYRTRDLGGHSTTQEVVDAVLAALDWPTATVLTNFVIYGVLTSLVFFFSHLHKHIFRWSPLKWLLFCLNNINSKKEFFLFFSFFGKSSQVIIYFALYCNGILIVF